MMEERQIVYSRVGRGALWIFSGTVIGYALMILYRIFLVRYLGPYDYGMFSLVLMLIGIFTAMFTFGLPGSATKFISENISHKERYNRFFGTGARLAFVLGVVGSLLMFLLSEFFAIRVFDNDMLTTYFRIGSVGILATLLHGFMGSSFSGIQKFSLTAASGLLEKAGKLVITLLLLFLGYGLVGVIFGYITGLVLSFSFLFLYALSRKYFSLDGFDIKTAKRMTFFGIPLLFGGISGTILGWTDTMLIGYFLNEIDVGLYNAVLPILWMLGILVASLSTALLPTFSQIHTYKNRSMIDWILNSSLRYSLIIMVPIATGAIVLSREAVSIVFGTAYMPASTVLSILAVGSVFLALNSIFASFVTGMGRSNEVMYTVVGSAVFNAILNVLLIVRYGIDGASIATTISLALAFLMYNYFARRDVVFKVSYIWKPVVSSLIMAAVVVYLKSVVAIGPVSISFIVASGAIVYFATMFSIKGIDKSDTDRLRKIFAGK